MFPWNGSLVADADPRAWALASDDSSEGGDAPVPDGAGAGPTVLTGKRVLIVEDEGITQMQLRKICQSAGMVVVGIAGDGQEGLIQALSARPDMILLDINLPVLDGLSAAEQILKEFTPCVVMLSAYDGENYQGRAQALGACGYIVKPVNSASLLPQLRQIYEQFQRKPD